MRMLLHFVDVGTGVPALRKRGSSITGRRPTLHRRFGLLCTVLCPVVLPVLCAILSALCALRFCWSYRTRYWLQLP